VLCDNWSSTTGNTCINLITHPINESLTVKDVLARGGSGDEKIVHNLVAETNVTKVMQTPLLELVSEDVLYWW
jgi:hypothetical protein